MSESYDFVVAGAGHNSLVAAAYLARAGYRVVVVEDREVAGGDCTSEELTLPGFLHDPCASAHTLLQTSPVVARDELGLVADHGLEWLHNDPSIHLPFPDGAWLTQWRDPERTCEEIARFSAADAAAYRRLLAEWAEDGPALSAALNAVPGLGEPVEAVFERLPRGRRWQRRFAMSAWDVIRTTFQEPHVRAFMLWCALLTNVPPDQPLSGRLAYALVAGRQRFGFAIPKGGAGRLVAALVAILGKHGGEVLTGRRVTRLIVEGGRCTGVECADGSRHLASRGVVSTIHPRHLLGMAPEELWDDGFRYGVETFQAGPAFFVSHYALTEPPRYPVGGGHVELAPAASGLLESVERALRLGVDTTLGLADPASPWLLVLCATVADPGRAPAGRHTLKLVASYPYELAGGPARWDDIKDEVADAHLATLRRYAPNLTADKVLARHVKSPLDLERMNRANWHGSCHGGAPLPAQSGALRPAPGWAQHRLPIPGLYQTGATTHPGGSITGIPGRNAAAVILADQGRDLGEAIRHRA